MWILLKPLGLVSGFYYENPLSRPLIESVGIVSDNSATTVSLLPPQYHTLSNLPKIATDLNLYVSFAVMKGLSKALVCRKEGHCTGILLHYNTGSSMVLGQWHSSSVSKHSYIYNSEKMDFINIYFKMSGKRPYQIVEDIGFSINPEIWSQYPDVQIFDFETVTASKVLHECMWLIRNRKLHGGLRMITMR